MRTKLLLIAASLLATVPVACTVSTSSTPTPDSGTSPTDDASPGAADGGSDSSTCTADGSLTLTVKGVPDGQKAQITIEGADGKKTVEAGSITLASGSYTIAAADIAPADPIARTVYRATLSKTSVTVCGDATETVDITYAPIPSSGKVWASNANGSAYVLGWNASVLGATSTQPASVVAKTDGAKGIAFDKEGNLWSVGATVGDPTLLRYPAASLGASGDKTADRKITIEGTGCSPAQYAIAFDPAGNLWVSNVCEQSVARLAPSELAADATLKPSVVITGLTNPKGIAFDGAGNLWIADAKIRRFDKARLSASTSAAADTSLTIENADSEELAFDEHGDLWSVGGMTFNLARVAKADLAGTGERTVTPPATISVGVGALPAGIAFDESGGMWLESGVGTFARLAPGQLSGATTSAGPTVPERVITSSDVGTAGSFAIYPAPASLPLYHRLATTP